MSDGQAVGARDVTGTSIEPGDWVVYGGRDSSSSYLRVAQVDFVTTLYTRRDITTTLHVTREAIGAAPGRARIQARANNLAVIG